jgi:NhaP-type Na+/H+ or K+/H+ antiporter
MLVHSVLRVFIAIAYVDLSIGGDVSRIRDLEREIAALKIKQLEISVSLAQRRLEDNSGDNLNLTHHADGNKSHVDGNEHNLTEIGKLHDTEHHDEHGEHVHQQEALLYLVIVLIIGASIMQLTTVPWLHNLPYTVVLFVLGVSCALFYHWLEHFQKEFGVFGRSYEMWMGIQPHLLMFVMLPVLLTGDAMTMDTAVAKRVAWQCAYLAGPGVALGALLTATFLYFYLQWEFVLCVAAGAILSATDPVAVVSLLKELGASPTLTIQIQGESLLNDGSAVVLFQVAYNMLKGEVYDVKGVIIFFVYMVVGSWFLGMVIGGVFSSWIRSASDRLNHHSGIIQLSCSLCCAYWSFIFAEGVLGLSGILSTVAAGVVMADSIWPKIVSKQAMHEVWHTFEYLGNTLLFFLAGALTGEAIFLVEPMDFVHLLVLYVVLLFVRGFVIFGSRPILRRLSPDREPVPLADCLVMTWGGLRGAVGLALAIQVNSERAAGNIEEEKAVRVLFFTGGIAALTLIFNATTCPMLVNYLGITATCNARSRILLQVHRRLSQIGDKMNPGHADLEPMIDNMLAEVKRHIEHDCQDVTALLFQTMAAIDEGRHNHSKPSIVLRHVFADQCSREVQRECFDWWKLGMTCKRYCDAKEAFNTVPSATRELLGWDHAHPLLRQEKQLIDLVELGRTETDMVRAVNEAFIALVRNEYWRQIDRGEFVPGTNLAEILLNSTADAHLRAGTRLTDFDFIRHRFGLPKIGLVGREKSSESERSMTRRLSRLGKGLTGLSGLDQRTALNLTTFCKKISDTAQFHLVMVILCAADAVRVLSDPGFRRGYATIVVDIALVSFFLVEMVIKLIGLRREYFTNGWRVLDLMCVMLGLFEIVIGILMDSGSVSSDDLKSEFLLIKLGRIFRVMRTMRVIVFVRFLRHVHAKSKGKKVSAKLADRLERIVTLRSFVQAHLHSHHEFVRYFGQIPTKEKSPKYIAKAAGAAEANEFGILTEPEQARCIIESWAMVYEAVYSGSKEIEKVNLEGPWILEGMCTLQDSMVVADSMLKFAISAVHAGVIHETDAECVIHPIHKHLSTANTLLADIHSGIISFNVEDHRGASQVKKAIERKRCQGDKWNQSGVFDLDELVDDGMEDQADEREAAIASEPIFFEGDPFCRMVSPESMTSAWFGL